MKILVVGSGGREHALCWRLSLSPSVKKVYCAPGNPGTAQCATNVSIQAGDTSRLADFARQERIDLTLVGPEVPLCQGIRDHFDGEGLRLLGPTKAAARLEGSKAFAKMFLERHDIPTAPFGVFENPDEAAAYIAEHPRALVVKADGLAAGKGVLVCSDPAEAQRAARQLLSGSLGGAGNRVVVEEKLEGEEASFIVLTDGERICPFESSQDHKAVYDGDAGPNTGGMGAYSPAPVLEESLRAQVIKEIVEPTIHKMAEEGYPYQGILYVGLMITNGQVQVLEFNCRMGDPEAQPLMARLTDDLAPALLGAAEGRLPAQKLRWDPRVALCVVMASKGYPSKYEKGFPISGITEAEQPEEVVVFHAGTTRRGEEVVTAGGRVLGVTALGDGFQLAQANAYKAVERIHWEGVHFRRDIGYRAVHRLNGNS